MRRMASKSREDQPSAPAAIADRAAILLSGLCAVHCLTTTLLVSVFAGLGEMLGAPIIHEAGLAIAVILGAVALGLGVRQHGLKLPLLLGGAGLSLMALALTKPHGAEESALTFLGVSVLAIAHLINTRLIGRTSACRAS